MIENLVSELPEVYQPIYGHAELSIPISRPCVDRLEPITLVYDTLQRLLGRPLKVLDLGCAQGFFSLNLAERGAIVHGVDFLPQNIAVCSALAQEYPSLQVSFATGRVEDVIGGLKPRQYDLVLGLSVFHHVIHENGVDAVKELLEHASMQSGALLVELASREETLYWAPAQPADPRTLLDPIAFVYELARHGTHLGPIARPLFLASSRYWILEDHAARFDSWSLDPHVLAEGTHHASRRYFFSTDCVLKHYRFDHPRGEHNKTEFAREVSFLQNPPPGFPVPALLAMRERQRDAWVVMERLPGRLLIDLLRHGSTVDKRGILLATLAQLAVLESAGLYHDDVRTWNVLVAEDGNAHLIDFGSISSRAQDCAWPRNPFLAFFIFVREVVTGRVDQTDSLRIVSISPYGLPHSYRQWATSLWKRPMNEWSFQLMYETLLEAATEGEEQPILDANSAWMKAIEEAVQELKEFSNHVRQQAEAQAQQAGGKAQQAEAKAQQAEAKAQQAEAKAQQAEAQAQQAGAKAQQAEAQAQQAGAKAQQAEVKAQQVEVKAQQANAESQHALAQLNAIYGSTSWRITAPMRASRTILSGSLPIFARATRITRTSIAKVPSARRVYHLTKNPVGHGIRYVARRPRLKRTLRVIIRWFPSFERWVIERRAAQVRADFSRTWSEKELGSARQQTTDTTPAFAPDLHTAQRNVDEILGRILAELYPLKGDQ
jgi:O-antigen chain-terminating bifunctional methyltransferase/kinase